MDQNTGARSYSVISTTNICTHIFSSPGPSPGRSIVLPPAFGGGGGGIGVSKMFKFYVKVLKIS